MFKYIQCFIICFSFRHANSYFLMIMQNHLSDKSIRKTIPGILHCTLSTIHKKLHLVERIHISDSQPNQISAAEHRRIQSN